jgi:outer membrane protein assembly factor BamE (lipoprotein component of BamABCDE complex)
MIASVFRPARPWLVAATVAATCLLGGCDSHQEDAVVHRLKQLFRSIQPAPLLLRSLKAGVSTEDDVRAQLGKPETERRNLDGSKRLEYPRGPMGDETYMVDIDRNGLYLGATQVLTADSFAMVRPGMTQDEVRQLLGKPTEVARYPLKPETVWSWRWRENGVNQDAFYNVHFGDDGLVTTTSRSDLMQGR